MAKRVSFSGENISLSQAYSYYRDLDASLRLFFSSLSPHYLSRFTGYNISEVQKELEDRIAELDLTTTMSILAAAEAAFRIDYLQRCYLKKKDAVSLAMIAIHKEKEARASLEDDILEAWKANTIGSSKIISDLRGAFKFRHWMAHGRYWTPKLGRKYDYASVYPLVYQAFEAFQLLKPDKDASV